MTPAAIVCMVVVIGFVVGGFVGLLALAIRHDAKRGAGGS